MIITDDYEPDRTHSSIWLSGLGWHELIVNPHRTVMVGDHQFKRQKAIKGFRIAPINPAKRPAPKRKRRR